MQINDRFLAGQNDAQEMRLTPDEAAKVAGFAFATTDVPREIGGYQVVRELGRGGHGVVYLAHRPGESALVAIKLIRRDLADERIRARVIRELDALESCQSAAVPRVHGYGTYQDGFYIAIDYVEGMPIDKHAANSGLGVRARVALLERACAAIQSLHEVGIIHRDIKPSNLLTSPTGEVRVIDLGTARLDERANASQTVEGTVLGTPACMAPEQARGEVSSHSVRADVFGLGAVGFLLLTGASPFALDGTPQEVLRRIGDGTPRRARDLDDSLPKDLAAILDKAIAPRADERFESVSELRAELRRWLDGVPTLTAAPGVVRRTMMFARRRPAATAGRASIVGLAIGLIVAAGLAASNARTVAAKQQVLDVHVAEMKYLATTSSTMLEIGNYRSSLLLLATLGSYVRNGGHLEDGLITFSEDYEERLAIAIAEAEAAEAALDADNDMKE